jgi:hypothetical protein
MDSNRASTPVLEPHNKYEHHTTPNRAKIQAVFEFNDSHRIKYHKPDVFAFFHVSERTGWRIISKNRPSLSARTHHNDPNIPEARGRKSKLTGEQIKRMDEFIQSHGYDARVLTWLQLADACEIYGLSTRTIARAMGNNFHYSQCIACRHAWVSPSAARNRLQFATTMLNVYPTPESWHRVRFSDEVHFGFGPQGRLRILRQPGERYCGDCIQEINEPKEKDRKRIHCWAAIGYNFKSDIYFYTTKSDNGKMTQQDYITQILEVAVKPWLERGDDFVLEEDGDSSHGPTDNNNIVRQWKKKHRLESYFNCAQSPDLAPIENCWQPTKQNTRRHAHWDDETLTELIKEGWAGSHRIGLIVAWIQYLYDYRKSLIAMASFQLS